MSKLKKYLRLCVAVSFSIVVMPGYAQTWPSKPVTIVVPQAAGGGADVLVREVAMRLQPALNQPIIIENKPGAGGIIGTEFVARSAPDGYTFVMGATGANAINPSLYKNIPYDAVNDFIPVVKVATAPLVVVARPGLSAGTMKEVIDMAKQEPDKLTFGSAGSGNTTHLTGELFRSMTGAQILHVPFKGAPQSEIALMGDHVDLMFGSIMTSLPHAQEGRMKALAVTSVNRSSIAPELPTVDEAAGVQGFDVNVWYGLFAPAGTSPEIVARMHAEVNKVLQDPELQRRFVSLGAETGKLSQQEFDSLVKTEIDKWAQVIASAGVQIE